jgi:predicted ATPase
MHFGAFSKARSEFETILRLYDPRQHRSQPVHYVHDPKVSALTYLALVLWVLGFPDQARHASAAAFRGAAELHQANLMAHVHNFAGARTNCSVMSGVCERMPMRSLSSPIGTAWAIGA